MWTKPQWKFGPSWQDLKPMVSSWKDGIQLVLNFNTNRFEDKSNACEILNFSNWASVMLPSKLFPAISKTISCESCARLFSKDPFNWLLKDTTLLGWRTVKLLCFLFETSLKLVVLDLQDYSLRDQEKWEKSGSQLHPGSELVTDILKD